MLNGMRTNFDVFSLFTLDPQKKGGESPKMMMIGARAERCPATCGCTKQFLSTRSSLRRGFRVNSRGFEINAEYLESKYLVIFRGLSYRQKQGMAATGAKLVLKLL
jgi:hypothetical protein